MSISRTRLATIERAIRRDARRVRDQRKIYVWQEPGGYRYQGKRYKTVKALQAAQGGREIVVVAWQQ